MEEMQIIIENGGQNGISNYEPLKEWALEHIKSYKGLVVQEDDIASAKADCAKLRKVAKNADGLRISVKKEHEAKIAKTLEQLKEIADIFNSAAADIDAQVKGFDEKRKQEKSAAIGKIYSESVGDMEQFLPLEKIYNEKWMNKGYSISDIEKEIRDKVFSVKENIDAIRMLGTKYESQMISTYLVRFEMADVLKKKAELEQIDAELERRRKAKEEEQRKNEETQELEAGEDAIVVAVEEEEEPVEPIAEEREYRLAFEVFGSKEQLNTLCNFIRENGYRYNRLP